MILTEAKDLRRGDVIPGLGLVSGVWVDGRKLVAVRIHGSDGPRLVKYRRSAWVKLNEPVREGEQR